jgi:hypothetical protein
MAKHAPQNLDELRAFVTSLRTEQNSTQVDYILEDWIAKGKTPRQMRACFSQTLSAKQWQASYGPQQYRPDNQAAADLFEVVIGHIEHHYL